MSSKKKGRNSNYDSNNNRSRTSILSNKYNALKQEHREKTSALNLIADEARELKKKLEMEKELYEEREKLKDEEIAMAKKENAEKLDAIEESINKTRYDLEEYNTLRYETENKIESVNREMLSMRTECEEQILDLLVKIDIIRNSIDEMGKRIPEEEHIKALTKEIEEYKSIVQATEP